MMVYRLLISFFAGILFLNTASAQWVNVAPNLLGNIPSTCCAFGSFAYKDGIAWVGRTGVWMSVDSGKTWTTISVSFNGVITQIEFFDKNTGVFGTDGGDVVLTTDQGKSWNQIHSGGQCYGVSFCGSANNIIVVSDYAGIFYTNDQGKNWNSAPTGGHILCCLGKKDGSALVHNEGEIRRTTDLGKSWQSIGTVDYDSWTLAQDSSSSDNVYLMNEEGHIPTDNKASVFHSIDGGITWVDLDKHPGTFFSGSLATTRKSLYAQTLNNGIFKSTDQGQTWVSICGPSNNIDSRLICAIDDENIIASDAGGSIWHTTSSKSGSFNFSISSKRIIKDSFGVTVYLPIYLKASSVMPALDMIMHYPTLPLEYIKSVTLSGKSVDGPGGAWAGRAKLHFDAADLAARKDSLIGYCLFKWSPYEYDCAHIVFDSMQADLPETPCSGKITAVGTAHEGLIGSFPSCGLAMETDIDPPQFIFSQNKNHSSDTLTVNDGRSTDEGLKSITWIAEQGTDTTKIVVLPVTPPVTPCYDDKINHTINVVQLDSTSGGCYDFTFTDCLWHKSYDTICFAAHLKSGVNANASSALLLEANHPNPFSHITTFSYSTSEYGMIRLYLYDELGREVARIVDMTQSPGSHSIDFNGSKLAAGSYTVRLESSGKVLSRRVVIER